MKVRVLVVDDNAVIRGGVRSLLEASDGVSVTGEAADGREAIEKTRELRPDVVLLDVRMPGMDGLTALPEVTRHARVMMLTYAEDEPIVAEAVRAGASGYLVHGRFDADGLASAVRTVAAGQSVISPAVAGAVFGALREGPAEDARREPAPVEEGVRTELSAREREVMDLLSQGLARRDVAERLFLSEKTVKNHINRIYSKLGAANRAEALAAWLGTRRPGG